MLYHTSKKVVLENLKGLLRTSWIRRFYRHIDVLRVYLCFTILSTAFLSMNHPWLRMAKKRACVSYYICTYTLKMMTKIQYPNFLWHPFVRPSILDSIKNCWWKIKLQLYNFLQITVKCVHYPAELQTWYEST